MLYCSLHLGSGRYGDIPEQAGGSGRREVEGVLLSFDEHEDSGCTPTLRHCQCFTKKAKEEEKKRNFSNQQQNGKMFYCSVTSYKKVQFFYKH